MPVKLKVTYEKAEEVPEGYAELYVEKNGKMVLTGIEGVKTQADIDALNEALRKERQDHKAANEKLAKWGDLEPEKVHTSLEELDDVKGKLQLAEKAGKVDEKDIADRIETAVNRATGPLLRDKQALERQIANKDKIILDKDGEIVSLNTGIKRSKMEGQLRDAAIEAKVLPTAIDDAVLVGANMIEEVNGQFVTKDSVGLTPGLPLKDFFRDMQEKRPHWWPASQGGGSGNRGTGAPMGKHADNPWSPEGWNLTKQGQYIKQHGAEKANQAAASVGSKVGATKPTKAAA